MMKKVYFSSVYISHDEELIQLIKKQIKGEDYLLHISMLLHKFQLENEYVDSIYVYIPKINKIIKSQEYKAVKNIVSKNEYVWIDQSKKESIIPISIQDNIGSVKKRVFMYSKAIYDSETNEYIGQVAINMDERLVYYTCLDVINQSLNCKSEIIDYNNVIVSSENLSYLGTKFEDVYKDQYIKEISQYTIAPFTGYSFVSILNRQALTKEIASVRNIIIITAIIGMTIAILIAVVTTNKMYSRVQNLKNAMHNLSRGNLKERVVLKGKDEISELSNGFNKMACQMEELIEELVSERLLKKEAELEALQYQITPHFLYNTLNSIKCLAYIKEADEIGDILEVFIELLRSSISKNGAFISLKDEIHLIENYVLLHKFRFQGDIALESFIAPDVERYFVPRLILQPLVENSILHGLDSKIKNNKITIKAKKEKDNLILSIEDNGKGMSEEERKNLFKRKNFRKEKFNSIGISNIKDRIELYYCQKGSIEYKSHIGKGVEVIIKIPAMDNMENM
ncbi:sensor histidine kinase [Anaeromicrobium sediminis]|uniref:histidine kinase n=1 Tax=Anaeromicrobium sediminis TaxID=1478221 RepID=A0A267MAP8_9FIRM|nr:histidine kinase [Anaeromicrobium sediminis]PAB56639.1 hypothetical protein CCE28_20620 [Anaeromicrobium sediminis]